MTVDNTKVEEARKKLNAGVTCYNEEQWDDAIIAFEEAFSIMRSNNFQLDDERMSTCYRLLADCLGVKKNNQQRIECYLKSLDHKWDTISAHNLFETLFSQKRYDDALQFFEEGRRRGGFPFITYNHLSQIYESKGKFQEAFDSLDIYIARCNEISPHPPAYDSTIMRRKGDLLRKLGKYKEADFCYAEAEKLDKNKIT